MSKQLKSLSLFITLISASIICLAGMKDDEFALAKSTMDNSGVTALKSLNIVQQQFKGIVYDYELDTDEDNDDELIHQIKLIDIEEDVKRKITISAVDGRVTEVEENSLFSWFYEDDSLKKVKKLLELNFSITEAMAVIGSPSDSIFYDIELEDKLGVVYFELEIFGPQGEKELLVDAKTKAVIPVYQR